MAERGVYRNLAGELRKRIDAGDLQAGAMIPSEADLAEQFAVARGTVRTALGLLVDEGRIEVVAGRGRRVVGSPGRSPASAAYEVVADELRRAIRAGTYAPDDRLPSEAELAARYAVSRNTVRRAYRALVEEGVVVVKHGVGAFVAPR